MDRSPLVTKRTRIIAEQLKQLRKPIQVFLTALYALFGPPSGPPQPPRPPVKKLSPHPTARKPPGVPDTRPKPPLPIDRDARSITTVLGTDVTTGREVGLTLEERFQGQYVIGANGTGKTTVILNMIISDIYQGRGVGLVEPHGDLTKQVIAGIPESRLKDVVYIDLMDSHTSYGFNFFEVDPGADTTDVAKVASFVQHLFEAVWLAQTETTPRLAMVLRNVTRVMIENPGIGTFAEIPLLLWEDGVREKLVRRVRNTQTKLFWSQYNKKNPHDREELIASTINKVDAYLNEPLVARIVSQSSSTIDFRRVMDEGKILLVHLSPQLEEPSRLIGSAILGRLLMAAFSRTGTPKSKRRPFMIYADEYQRFATNDFAVFLAEARKAKVSTTVANQVLEQLSDLNRATALQAGTVVVMRVSGEDSKILGSTFDATPQPALVGEEPVRAVVADPISHMTAHGHPHPTVATFIADYLLPLAALLRKTGNSPFAFQLGCAIVLPSQVIEGQRQLSEAFATCMRERRSDVFLPPWALFVLGASDPELTFAFRKDFRREWGYLPIVGITAAANRYGRASFDTTKDEDLAFLRAGVKTSIFESSATRARRVCAFIRMHKAIRQTLGVLAKEPLMTATGLYQPKYQLRTYSDQENLVANAVSQLPNYHAKVRLLTGEHTIKTRPAPELVSEREVEARIQVIKQRMLRDGVTLPAAAIEEEVRKRHELLRRRPDDDTPPPIHSNGRRKR